MHFLIINGPNINMLGLRQPEIYGTETYNDLVGFITSVCEENDIEVEFFQSNHEGAIIDRIQMAYGKFDGIIINPAAFTHTSIAILDALTTVNIPTAEVHITDITQREDFRQISFVGLACQVRVIGLGIDGYAEAILQLKDFIEDPPRERPESDELWEEEIFEEILEEELLEEESAAEDILADALLAEEILEEVLEDEFSQDDLSQEQILADELLAEELMDEEILEEIVEEDLFEKEMPDQ